MRKNLSERIETRKLNFMQGPEFCLSSNQSFAITLRKTSRLNYFNKKRDFFQEDQIKSPFASATMTHRLEFSNALLSGMPENDDFKGSFTPKTLNEKNWKKASVSLSYNKDEQVIINNVLTPKNEDEEENQMIKPLIPPNPSLSATSQLFYENLKIFLSMISSNPTQANSIIKSISDLCKSEAAYLLISYPNYMLTLNSYISDTFPDEVSSAILNI